MSQYKLIFTDVGIQKKQNAELNNDYINITKFAVGSGTITTLVSSMTALVSEEYRTDISNMDTKNGVTYFDCIIPETVGGFYIREIGLIDDVGDVIAIGIVPETYKVDQDEGASKSVHLKVSTTSSNSDNITFLTDASTVFATLSYVNGHINDKSNPHQVTKAQVGLGNVDNTKDMDKPISTSVAAALALKTNIADIKNNLTSTDTNKPLSAYQGKVLKGLIDQINTLLLSDTTALDTLQEIVDFIELNRADLDTLGISNIAGLQTALNGKLGINSNAVSATKLATARNIGGVSFNGTASINLPGVNVAGNQNTSGNAASTTKLQTARSINGTSFNGTASITTSKWGTARNFTIGTKTKSVNGSGAISFSLAEIGAQAAGTYNTVIGTDSDINTAGATIIDNIYVTDGVITSMGTRTLTASNIGAAYIVAESLGVNGYRKWSNGKIEQWGVATDRGTFTFPIAFPTECYNVLLTHKDYPGFSYEYPGNWVTNVTNTGAEIGGGFQSTNDWYWAAIGK